MVELAKHANFWSNSQIVVIFFPRYQKDLTKTLKHVWYALVWLGMVEMAKNTNFWSNGPIVVIFFPTLSGGPN